jgi:transposase
MKPSPKLTIEQVSDLQHVIRNGDARAVRKAQAILLVNQEAGAAGIPVFTGYSEKHAYKIRRAFLTNGIDAIRDKRNPKPRRLLTKSQRAELVATIKTKQPCELDIYLRL